MTATRARTTSATAPAFAPLPDETPCGDGLICLGAKCVPIPDWCKGIDCGPATACPPLQCEKATGKCVPVPNPARYDGNLTLTSDAEAAAAAQYSEVTGFLYIDKGSLTHLELPKLSGEKLHAQLLGFGFAGGFTNTGGAPGPCVDPALGLYPFTTHTFTNAGAEGTTGPGQAAIDAAYAASQVAGHVTVDAARPEYQK